MSAASVFLIMGAVFIAPHVSEKKAVRVGAAFYFLAALSMFWEFLK